MSNAELLAPADQPMRTRVMAFLVMCVGFFIATLDIQIVASSLKDIGGGLSASQDELSWVQTSYLIAEILVIPMSGWLTRVFSTRWVFAISSLGFTLTSLLCGLAWNINSMIAFRALQGFLGGAMIPTVFTTAFVFFPGKQRVIAAAAVGGLASLAPTLGPVVGGWITDTWSWHWLFFLNLAPGLFITVAVLRLLHIDKPDLSLLKRGDYIGIVLMSGFLGCLEYVLEEGPRKDWFGDTAIMLCACISAICGGLFLIHAFTAREPIVDLRALAIRNFSIGCILSFITGVGIFCTVYLTPLFLARVRGFSSLQTGMAMLVTGVFQLAAMGVYSAIARYVDMRWLLLFGLACFAVGCYQFTPLTNQWGWQQMLLPQAVRGFAQQFCVAPVVTMALGSLPPARLRLASGLFNLMRNLGGAIGIAVASTMLNDRLNLHYLRINEHLTRGSANLNAYLAASMARLGAATNDGASTLAQASAALLRQRVMREALVLTFSDTYLAVAACLALGIVFALFSSRLDAAAAPPVDAH
ncbi:MAG: DHA2 family efflux MFS transporter permease subunit [Janthinobacterium lividum]